MLYQVKSKLVQRIAEVSKDKIVDDIADTGVTLEKYKAVWVRVAAGTELTWIN